MKISGSSIGMESERLYTTVRMEAHLHSETYSNISANDFLNSLKGNIKKEEVDKEEKENEDKKKDNNDLSNMNSSLEYLKGKYNEISAAKTRNINNSGSEIFNQFRVSVIKYILMLLMGKDVDDLFDVAFGGGTGYVETTSTDTYIEYSKEEEMTTYKASGKVLTEDGREIDFGIDLCMSRSFEEYIESTSESKSVKQMLMDPIVINFDSSIANIGDQKFIFDLNSDGIEDEVANVSSGSGFLALDKNNDGIINDGNELFGTKSGDGFRDLSAYDLDGNGWIDENDEVFDKLKIMAVNEDGSQSLFTLKEKGVGAIYLGNVNTDFLVTNSETNKVNAAIRKTGIFLYENGGAGTVQHVDLAVELGA